MTQTQAHAHIDACELLIGYEFRDKAQLARALNASGNPTMFDGRGIGDNKALAVFGDLAMEARLCRQWLATGASRGKTPVLSVWDGIRKLVLDNSNLARAGFAVGLQACIKVYGMTAVSAKMMATTVEAIAGAAFLDGGEEALADVMQALGLTDERLEDATVLVTFTFIVSFQLRMSALYLLADMAYRSPGIASHNIGFRAMD